MIEAIPEKLGLNSSSGATPIAAPRRASSARIQGLSDRGDGAVVDRADRMIVGIGIAPP